MVAYAKRRNEDYPWHEFDPESYLEHNYSILRDEDRRTIEIVRDFFGQVFASDPVRTGRRGIDVGTGANLYPALAMLPFCDRLTLYEYSSANIDWLARQHAAHWPTWSRIWARFWLVLSEHTSYSKLAGHPKVELARCAEVVLGSVFDLGASEQRWDVGTMFFVAESITPQRSEFIAALNHFIDALKPGAPFALAFMEQSVGYQVGGKAFPAIAVSCDDVRYCLRRRATGVVVERLDIGDRPLRLGYSGTIVACGKVRVAPSAGPDGR